MTDIQPIVDEFFPTIRRYWRDPVFRDALDAETRRQRDRANTAIDAGMRKFWENRDARS